MFTYSIINSKDGFAVGLTDVPARYNLLREATNVLMNVCCKKGTRWLTSPTHWLVTKVDAAVDRHTRSAVYLPVTVEQAWDLCEHHTNLRQFWATCTSFEYDDAKDEGNYDLAGELRALLNHYGFDHEGEPLDQDALARARAELHDAFANACANEAALVNEMAGVDDATADRLGLRCCTDDPALED